jgi:hypothetical protein
MTSVNAVAIIVVFVASSQVLLAAVKVHGCLQVTVSSELRCKTPLRGGYGVKVAYDTHGGLFVNYRVYITITRAVLEEPCAMAASVICSGMYQRGSERMAERRRITEYDDGNIHRAKDAKLVCFLQQTCLALSR